MKAMFLLALTLAAQCRADETADRAAIKGVMAALTDSRSRTALFAADVDVTAELKSIDRLVSDARPWSELPPPVVISESIRFVTPNVAVVDGRAARRTMQTVPLVAVLQGDSGQWRIVALRVVARTGPTP